MKFVRFTFKGYANIAEERSKPVYIISANEAAHMIKKALEMVG